MSCTFSLRFSEKKMAMFFFFLINFISNCWMGFSTNVCSWNMIKTDHRIYTRKTLTQPAELSHLRGMSGTLPVWGKEHVRPPGLGCSLALHWGFMDLALSGSHCHVFLMRASFSWKQRLKWLLTLQIVYVCVLPSTRFKGAVTYYYFLFFGICETLSIWGCCRHTWVAIFLIFSALTWDTWSQLLLWLYTLKQVT